MVEIKVKKIESRKGVYLMAPFNDSFAIKKSFEELFKQLNIHEIDFKLSKVYGIVSSHQGNIYKTFIELNEHYKIPKKFTHTEIKGGKYACFEVKGDKDETLKIIHYFYHSWLPNSGYKIADIIGFESFAACPCENNYDEIVRTLHVPIQAS